MGIVDLLVSLDANEFDLGFRSNLIQSKSLCNICGQNVFVGDFQ